MDFPSGLGRNTRTGRSKETYTEIGLQLGRISVAVSQMI